MQIKHRASAFTGKMFYFNLIHPVSINISKFFKQKLDFLPSPPLLYLRSLPLLPNLFTTFSLEKGSLWHAHICPSSSGFFFTSFSLPQQSPLGLFLQPVTGKDLSLPTALFIWKRTFKISWKDVIAINSCLITFRILKYIIWHSQIPLLWKNVYSNKGRLKKKKWMYSFSASVAQDGLYKCNRGIMVGQSCSITESRAEVTASA